MVDTRKKGGCSPCPHDVAWRPRFECGVAAPLLRVCVSCTRGTVPRGSLRLPGAPASWRLRHSQPPPPPHSGGGVPTGRAPPLHTTQLRSIHFAAPARHTPRHIARSTPGAAVSAAAMHHACGTRARIAGQTHIRHTAASSGDSNDTARAPHTQPSPRVAASSISGAPSGRDNRAGEATRCCPPTTHSALQPCSHRAARAPRERRAQMPLANTVTTQLMLEFSHVTTHLPSTAGSQ